MKKLFVILFAILYTGLASGFSTYQHICQGLVQQTSMSNSQINDYNCGFCAKTGKTVKEPKKNCCEEKVQVVKVKSEVQNNSFKIFKISFFTDAILHRYFGAVYEYIPTVKHNFTTYTYYLYRVKDVPLYIKNCVYRL
ncbi:MAG: HYC_CC_PP family protein [Flavobacterium sp.]